MAPATSDVGETSKLTIRNCGPIGLRLQEHPSGRGVCVARIDPKSHPAMYGCDDGVEVAVGMHIVAINEHNVSTYAFDTAMAVLRSVAQQRPCTLTLRHQSVPGGAPDVPLRAPLAAGQPGGARLIAPNAQSAEGTMAVLPAPAGPHTSSPLRLPRETLQQQVREKRTEMGVVASDAWVDEALKRASTVQAAVIWLMENSEPQAKAQLAPGKEGRALRGSV